MLLQNSAAQATVPLFIRNAKAFVFDDIRPKEGIDYSYNFETQQACWIDDSPLPMFMTGGGNNQTGYDTTNSDGNNDWKTTDNLWIEP